MKQTKKFFAMTLMLMACVVGVQAYKPVTVTISDGIYHAKTKSRMEQAASALLTEVNRAQEQKAPLSLNAHTTILSSAVNDITKIWNEEQFFCPDKEVVCRCLTVKDGYQVRGIPLIIVHEGEDSQYQEAVIEFDKKGNITSFLYTINPEIYSRLTQSVTTRKDRDVFDINERIMILKYVEQFRTAYNQKDISFLEQVFSDNALIITGHVIKTEKSDLTPNGVRIVYKKQGKKEYLTRLKGTFTRSRYIKVDFQDVTIAPHPTLDHVYGVTVLQSWKSGTYHDEGYVFMLWDFRKKNPKIHVRTWQPEYIEPGRKIDSNEIFSLEDFDL